MLNFIKQLSIDIENNKSASRESYDFMPLVAGIYKNCFEQLIITSKTTTLTTSKSYLGNKEVEESLPIKVPSSSTPSIAEQIKELRHDFNSRHTNQEDLVRPVPSSDDVWIFGYGSLVWKADFPYINRRRGYICGYKRRFYQHSIDHRGVPSQPGRVVTLLPGDPELHRVYGVAYRIAASQKRDVLDHLDYREKNGYERRSLEFHEFPVKTDESNGVGNDDGDYHHHNINNDVEQYNVTPLEVIMYVATTTNDSYAGDVWQVPRIAEQIFSSFGPSGSNREYLFNLDKAMHALFPGAIDEHLTELVTCVRELVDYEEPKLLKNALCKDIDKILSDCFRINGIMAQDKRSNDGFINALTQRLEDLHKQCNQPGWREVLITRELKLTQVSDDHIAKIASHKNDDATDAVNDTLAIAYPPVKKS